MNPPPIFNPILPYVGYIEGGVSPGRMIRIHGNVPITANRFAINLQCGPNTVPRDDIALHLNPRFNENKIVRNSLQCQSWGPEESFGHMPLVRGQPFEILILCEPSQFKIAINGQHYADYPHRIPYQRVSYLTIDGDVMVSQIMFEGGPGAGYAPPHAPPAYAPPGACPIPPYPPGSAVPPYPPTAGTYPPQPAPYPAYPPHAGMHGPGMPPGYPPTPPGYIPGSSHNSPGGLLGKASAALGGILGTGGHGGHGGHGALAGTALGAGLTGAALTGHLSPKKAAKKQKKMAKKALKYGLPVAGVGLGAYALSRGFHHHHHSSSSSSSSSSSEEE